MSKTTKHPDAVLSGLLSERSTQRLEQIANLRARGIGEDIDLPQLVVCGDQSAGKSSVLEGITRLPFPRQDGVCTKFATEIILCHTETPAVVSARIIPFPQRSAASKTELLAYERRMADFDELPSVIAEVGALCGVRGFGNVRDGPAFVEDILRIKVTGRTGLHLMIVDLPGLISVPNEEQTDDDVRTVHNLVDSYLQSSRTVIMAVVQANNDIANQAIVQKSKKFDQAGVRTIGIITKADLINKGTEGRIAALARNQDTTKLKLGFFLLKNPSPSEIAAGITQQQREENESGYFESSPWKEQLLDMERVGIGNMRRFLQALLDQHVERELPKVREEVKSLMKTTEDEILSLGDERPTPGHVRMFLSRIAMRFYNITTAALHGDYHGTDAAFFTDKEDTTSFLRLRAFVHNVNTAFAHELRKRGQTMRVVEEPDNEPNFVGHSQVEDEEGRVTEAEMREFVLKLYRKTRGRELPGNYNYVLMTELFHHQSKPWKTIASEHLIEVFQNLCEFVRAVVGYISADEQLSLEMLDRIDISLLRSRQSAEEELDRLCDDEAQQPITYNHYYTDTIQKARQDGMRNWLKKAMEDAAVEYYNGKLHISNTAADGSKLLQALQKQVTVDMDDQACEEALAGFDAYYKVARKTFVDNVCKQVIERHLLRKLPSFFSPETVATYTDEELNRVAGERENVIVRREQLRNKLASLAAGFQDLRR